MEIFLIAILAILAIFIYLLIGIGVSLGVHVAHKYFDFEFLDIDEGEDMLIVFWPLYIIGLILILPVAFFYHLYEEIVEFIDDICNEREGE